MPLVNFMDAADLTLSFVTPDGSRLTRDLSGGEVRLTARHEDGDQAAALRPGSAAEAREVGAALMRLARELKATRVRVPASEHAAALAAAALAEDWRDGRYRQATPAPVQLFVEGLGADEQARIEALGAGLTLARDLVSAPANVLNPATLAREARTLEAYGVDVDVWDGDDITARGMNLLAAVAAGR